MNKFFKKTGAVILSSAMILGSVQYMPETFTKGIVIVASAYDGFKIVNGCLEEYNGPGGVVSIPYGVTDIGRYVFSGRTDITSVIIPSGTDSVGDYAFEGCTNLTSVTFPSSLTLIANDAFNSCSSLSSISIPNSVTTIGMRAFESCTSLSAVTIPGGASLGIKAFNMCSGLKTVTVSEGVTAIPKSAFDKCTNLNTVNIPSTVTTIGANSFGQCSKLSNVYYNGTAEQWNSITIDATNTYLKNASIHYSGTAQKAIDSIAAIADQTYKGSAITPALTVKSGNTTLNSGTDYTVSYSNNVNVGTATVTVTGMGNYTGTKTATFKITQANASSFTISAIEDQPYTGSAITPAITVTFSNRILSQGTDYTVSYSNNVNKGTATVTVTGIGNFTGTKSTTFKIVDPVLKDFTISEIADQTYTGSAITPAVTVKDGSKTLTIGNDYTVSYSNNTNVGTATVTVTGKGEYNGTTKTASFKIKARNASNFTISSIADQTYTGFAITPAVTVKDGSKNLSQGTDYTVSYSNNTNVGTATVTVTGKGNYTGTKTADFKITARNASNFTISSIADQTFTGSAITPAVTVKDGSKNLTKGTDYTVSYSNNVNIGIATVTVTGKGNYTGTKTANFNIVSNTGILYGDANCDNLVNAKDVLAIRKYLVKNDPGVFNLAAADVNVDNAVNAKDVLKIRKYIVDPEHVILGQA